MHARFAILAFLVMSAAVASRAAAARIELVSDNDTDLYVPGAGTFDRNYTQGARIAWYGEPDALPARLERVAARLPGFSPVDAAGEVRTRRFGVVVGQEIWTPDAISRTRRAENDRPYAGWLYASAFLNAADERRFRSVQLGAGMVGPSSGAAQVQTWWHSRLGIRVPRGWRWQLRDEPGVFVRWDERARPWGRRTHADLIPHAGATLGNVSTEAHAGLTARLGLPLPDDFGPSPVTPHDPGTGARRTAYVFGRIEGRAVARDVFVDGNTFRAGPHVTRVPLVGEAQVGAGVRWGAIGVRYAFTYSTQRFRERTDSMGYGSLALEF